MNSAALTNMDWRDLVLEMDHILTVWESRLLLRVALFQGKTPTGVVELAEPLDDLRAFLKSKKARDPKPEDLMFETLRDLASQARLCSLGLLEREILDLGAKRPVLQITPKGLDVVAHLLGTLEDLGFPHPSQLQAWPHRPTPKSA